MALLLLFLVQSLFAPFKKIHLAGFEPQPEKVELRGSTLVDGRFQDYAEKKLSRTFGFREVFVRIYNQALYSVFNETSAEVITGKDGYLFETGYKPAVCAENAIGESRVLQAVDSLQEIDTWMRANNKHLLLLIAPNKWRYHRDKIDWGCASAEATNYDLFSKHLERTGITVLDYIKEFRLLKEKYPLFSKSGTHWSIYGAAVAATQLNGILNREGIGNAELRWDTVESSEQPRNTDKDLHDLLNIMAMPVSQLLGYPRISLESGTGPRTLVIGDSYYLTFYYLGLHEKLFAPGSKFFYYNKAVIHINPEVKKRVTPALWKTEWEKSELVLLVVNEHALENFGFGFLKDAWRLMANPQD